MKTKFIIFTVVLVALFSCEKKSKKDKIKNQPTTKTEIPTYTYNELKPLLEKNDNKTYVINFWATWCAPCVKELPAFEKLNENFSSKNVEVLLVSLDFPNHIESKLIPFLKKKKLNSNVIVLNDIDEDTWIKAIDANWTGAIPATLIYNKTKRKFYEQSFDYQTLENELKTFLKP